ncbi:hypothetical protein ACFL5G_05380 [Candidatus Margulisiibacteriota bacterium]
MFFFSRKIVAFDIRIQRSAELINKLWEAQMIDRAGAKEKAKQLAAQINVDPIAIIVCLSNIKKNKKAQETVPTQATTTKKPPVFVQDKEELALSRIIFDIERYQGELEFLAVGVLTQMRNFKKIWNIDAAFKTIIKDLSAVESCVKVLDKKDLNRETKHYLLRLLGEVATSLKTKDVHEFIDNYLLKILNSPATVDLHKSAAKAMVCMHGKDVFGHNKDITEPEVRDLIKKVLDKR